MKEFEGASTDSDYKIWDIVTSAALGAKFERLTLTL